MLRGLIHYWRINLAVVLAAAVATSVLTGALLVGDSVRGSLRALTLDRLGRIDEALVTEQPFRTTLAEALAPFEVAPALLLRGAAVQPDTGARASQVAIHGIDPRFLALYPAEQRFDLARREGQVFPSLALNETLARELGVTAGDAVLLTFSRPSRIPRDTLLGETDPGDVLATLRLQVAEVLPDRGVGRFGLTPRQQAPHNAFVELRQLQRVLQQPGRANALLLARGGNPGDPQPALRRALEPEDLGVVVRSREDRVAVESRDFVFRPDVEAAIEQAARDLKLPAVPVVTYLANEIRLGERSVPYSLVAALDPLGAPESLGVRLGAGGAPARISPDGILLNTWTAEDLGAAVGDRVRLEYYVVGPREHLGVEQVTLVVEGIVGFRGLGADRDLAPEYPGIQEADDIASWDPPFPVDLDRIRPRDEDYWDRYRATPKAFVALATGRRLWSTRYGAVNSIQLAGAPAESIEATAERVRVALAGRLEPEAFGFRFRPVRRQGLDAASGATDFAMLFVSFSFFLIASSALLIGLLFGLGVEQRAREIGLLLAVGYPRRRVRLRWLGEGSLLAAAGTLLGAAGGIGYAWLMLVGLRTLWIGAIGSSRLELYVAPSSLLLGAGISIVVILLSLLGSLVRIGRVPCPALLAGGFRGRERLRRGRLAPVLAWGGLLAALALVATALATGATESPALAFGAGAALLASGLAFFRLWCRGSRGGSLARGARALAGMAARNSAWNPGRSMLSVALVASACFVIVLVAASRHDFGDELRDRSSGSGGFSLLAQADVPLHQDLGRPADRGELGFDDEAERALEGVAFYPFRVLPGDDASCLNLYRPEKPRVLGVPPELVERGGFTFQNSVEPPDPGRPWSLLELPQPDGAVPAVADANSAQWILHKQLGDEIEIEDDAGGTVRLRLVGVLAKSIFQSEILISEAAFLRHFPDRSGYGYFLIDAPPERLEPVSGALESALARFGFDAVTTAEKLAAYQEVEHTYLSTFQLLGGLGLLLGTLGLGVVLVRNVMERRGELATLRACGFPRSSLVGLVLAENGFLLLAGVSIGSLSALLPSLPRLVHVPFPWTSVAGTLGVVLVVGMLASIAAVLGTLRAPLLPALKADR